MKKILSFLLALVMVLSMLPTTFPAMEVSAEGAAATEVTLTVTPSATHAVKAEGETNYTLTAALSLSTNTAFALGSLQFEATPAEGLSLELADPTATDAIPVEMGAGEEVNAGKQLFTWNYVPAVADDLETAEDETVVGVPAIDLTANTVYDLGTITMTSASPFSISDAKLVGTEACEYASAEENGTKYDLAVALAGEYAKGGHGDATTTWTPITSAADLANMANGGYYYLANDVTATAARTLDGVDVTLCLNGKTLSANSSLPRQFEMKNGAHLTICDCTASGTGDAYTAGTINPGSKKGGLALMYAKGSAAGQTVTLTVLDGIFDGNNTATADYCGFIRVEAGTGTATAAAKLDIQGGKFANRRGGCGGAILLSASTNAVATISNAQFVNCGAWQNYGGAITSEAGTSLTIDNCVFKNNKAQNDQSVNPKATLGNANGGAIYAAGKALSVTNSWFENNSAGKHGAAIYTSVANGTTISNCTFKLNNSGGHGVVYITKGNTTLTNCTFNQNTAGATTGGTAVYNEGSSILTLNSCTITENTAAKGISSFAAAVYTAGSSAVVVSGSTVVDNNTYGSSDIESNIFFDNASDSGKADRGYLNVNELTAGAKLSVVTRTSREASALIQVATGGTQTNWDSAWVTYDLKPDTKIVKNYDNTFSFDVHAPHADAPNETWTAWGDDDTEKTSLPTAAGYYYLVSDINMTTRANMQTAGRHVVICLNHHIVRGLTTNPDAKQNRIWYMNNGTVTMCDCTATRDAQGNLYAGKLIPGSNGDGCLAGMFPNGSSSSGATLNLTDVIVDGENTSRTVSAITASYVAPVGTGTKISTVNITGCEFKNYTTTSANGTIFANANSKVNITNSKFSGNSAPRGAAVVAIGADVEATGTTFINNRSTKDNTSGEYPAYYGGGAIYAGQTTVSSVNYLSDVTVDDCTFTDNSAVTSGGAIYAYKGKVSIQNGTTFTNNSAEKFNGGALMIDQAEVTIDDSVFTDNTAPKAGGAIYNNKGTVSIQNGTTFTNNKTESGNGGALYSSNAEITIDDTAFTQNKAPNGSGGAVYLNQKCGKISNCTFTENTAKTQAGAIRFTGVSETDLLSTTIEKCTFTRNESKYGGVAYSLYSTPTFKDCTFTGNQSTDASASVIYEESTSTVTLDDCTITGNSHKTTGSAVWVQATSSKLIVAGKTVIENNTNAEGSERNVYFESAYNTKNNNLLRVKDLEEGAKISVTTTDDRSDSTAKVVMAADGYTPNEETWNTAWIRYENNSKQIGYEDGAFIFTDLKVAEVNGEKYSDLTEALTQSVNGGHVVTVINPLEGTSEDPVTVTLPTTSGEQAVQIDLKGNSIGEGVKLVGAAGGTTEAKVVDTTLTYESDRPLVISKENLENVTIPSAYKVGNRRYVAIDTGDAYEIHRVQLAVSAKALRPSEMGVGVKVRFSKAMSLKDFTFGMNFVIKDGETEIKTVPMALNTELVNGRDLTVIITDYLADKDYAEYTVYGTPYIVLKETGETVYGSPVELSFKAMVQYADGQYNNLTDAQQSAIDAMCATDAFKATNYTSWGLQNIAQ